MKELDLVNAWLEYKQYNQGKSEATVNKYRGYIDRLALFLQGKEKGFLDATKDELEEFTGIHSHKEGLAPKSRRAIVAAVRGFYKWMKDKGHRVDDPGADVPYPNTGNKLPTPLETRHARSLLLQPDMNTFEGVRDTAILMVLIGCGIRVSGLVGLNESSLQLVDIDGKEWLVLKVLEKGKRERIIPAPHDVKYIMHAYLGHQGLDRIERTLPDGDRVLFVSTMNRTVPEHEYIGARRRISTRSVNDMIQKYGERAGIPRNQLHPHAMRHLYGTELAEHEVDVIMRQALLGHEDPKTTEIYTHLAKRNLAKVVDRINPFRNITTPITELVRELERNRG